VTIIDGKQMTSLVVTGNYRLSFIMTYW